MRNLKKYIRRERPNKHGLSRMQLRVMALLADGFSVKEIAGMFNKSEQDIWHHRAQIWRFLRLRSFAQMVKMAVGFGLSKL